MRGTLLLFGILLTLMAWPGALPEEAARGPTRDGVIHAEPPGTVFRVPKAAGDSTRITDDERHELERIATLGYLVGSDRAPAEEGVTISLPGASEGYTIYVSRGYPGAFLVDMRGRILHTWFDEEAPEWTRAWVYPDGSVLGISTGPGRLVKLDRDSRPLWTYGDRDLRAHHDLQVSSDGTIYVLTRRPRVFPWLRELLVQDDMVCILEPDGEVVREVDCISIPRAFFDSEYKDMLFAPWFVSGADPFHTNSVEILDGRVPHAAFRDGNVLVSIRNMDCLAVLDTRAREIVWVDRGRWQRQHEARITPDGNIMFFDNRMFEGQSRLVTIDPPSGEVIWEYTAPEFFSRGAGAQQVLPNGNVLVTETKRGRIFEIEADGRIVWEYLNPRRLDDGKTIARIARAFRVAYDYFTGPLAEDLAAQREKE